MVHLKMHIGISIKMHKRVHFKLHKGCIWGYTRIAPVVGLVDTIIKAKVYYLNGHLELFLKAIEDAQ